MKNRLGTISFIINIFLIVAVIILFSRTNGCKNTEEVAQSDTLEAKEPIAFDGNVTFGYFNMDSLNKNLLRMKDLETDIARAQKDAENKMLQEQARIDKWRKKWESRMPLLTNEQEKFQQEGQEMQMKAMQREQQIQLEFQMKEQEIRFGHLKRITERSKDFAEKNGIDVIMSMQIGQNPIYMHPGMDVTQELIDALNADYSSIFEEDAEEQAEESSSEE